MSISIKRRAHCGNFSQSNKGMEMKTIYTMYEYISAMLMAVCGQTITTEEFDHMMWLLLVSDRPKIEAIKFLRSSLSEMKVTVAANGVPAFQTTDRMSEVSKFLYRTEPKKGQLVYKIDLIEAKNVIDFLAANLSWANTPSTRIEATIE
jgi:hypothetical protein